MTVIVPGAEWRPVVPLKPITDLRWIILHTVVGTVAGSLGGADYHLYVRANGSFVQVHDLDRRSAASVQANPYSIAVVAEDKGPAFPAWTGSNVPAYTAAQVDTLIWILTFVCTRYGLPANALQTSCLDQGQGIGWHRLGIDGSYPNTWPLWGRRPGCQSWSLSTGKACPGDRRIRQIVDVIIPAVAAALGDDDLTPDEARKLDEVHRVLVANRVAYEADPTGAAHDLASRMIETALRAGAARDAVPLAAKTQTITAAVDTATGDVLTAAQQAKAAADKAVAQTDTLEAAVAALASQLEELTEMVEALQLGGVDPEAVAAAVWQGTKLVKETP